MKKIIFVLICSAILLSPISVMASAFCDGWDKGFLDGFCYKRANCSEPLVPVCPTPLTGKDTYKDGYDLGFPSGLNAWRLLNCLPLPYTNMAQTSNYFIYLARR